MTVSSTTSRVEYAGDGTTTDFTVPFYFLAAGDLVVIQGGTTLTINVDYTVTGDGDPAGGDVSFTTAPGLGDEVVIYRDPEITQEVDYAPNDPFPAETHEEALDRLTMIAQRLREQADRSLHISDAVTGSISTALPDPEADAALVWNATATALINRQIGDGTGVIGPWYWEDITDRPFVSVLEYGATGDGVTDDTAAVQAAFDANPEAEIYFPKASSFYKLSSSIILTDANGHDFQGSIRGDNAEIHFTASTGAASSDAAMPRGFASYPTTVGSGGDITGMRKVQISGLVITGPTHGASIYLANCQDVTLRDVRTTTSRYGVVTECCINTGFYDCVFEDYTNAGVGMLMLGDTARVWYGSALTPELTYWNDSPMFQKCDFKNSLITQPLAHILDHGSMAESVRSIGGCLLYSRWDGSGAFLSTQYGILARNAQWHSFGSNWTENVSYPIRILEEESIEGTGNVTAVLGAKPGGTYALTNFPDGYSYAGSFTGWWFARSFEALNLSGIRGVAYVGGNVDQLMQNGGVHLKSISTSTSGKVLDYGDSIVAPVGTYAYSSFVNGVRISGSAQWEDWTPTITASSGTITTTVVNKARYLQRGKEVQVRLDVTITTNGTGADAVLATLPVTAATNGGVLAGREDVVSGDMLQGLASGATLKITAYDNTYPGANGARLVLSGVYEAA